MAVGDCQQLPKLLYTSPLMSKEYRDPVCITHQDWDRMKFMLNKHQTTTAPKQNERFALYLKSQEMMKNWRDVPGNLHLIRRAEKQEKAENEEELREKLSEEIKKYHNKTKRETLAHNRLQLMCRSHKGRLLTKGLLSDAAAKERELQIAHKKKQQMFDKIVEDAYGKGIIEDQAMYNKMMKDRAEVKRKRRIEYYKDLDKQVEFQKQLKARLDEEKRLDNEHLKALDEEYRKESIQSEIDKNNVQRQLVAYYDKQCEEKKEIQKFQKDLDKYEDELIHEYVTNKRSIKKNHRDFLDKQKRLRQDKEDIVFDYIVKANDRKKDECVTNEIRIKYVKLIEEKALMKEKNEKEKFKAHVKECRERKIRQKNIWENIKRQELVEQIEEHLRTVEDDVQEMAREYQVQEKKRQFTTNVKKCQLEQIMEKAKRRESARILEMLELKHVSDAENHYDKDVQSFADDLIAYAKKQNWPTDHLNQEKLIAKWCDHDHLFLPLKRSLPKISKEIREAQYKQDAKIL